MKAFKKIITTSALIILCAACASPTEPTPEPSLTPSVAPVETTSPTPTPIPTETPEPSAEPSPEPTELIYEMTDNPKTMSPYDSSVKLIGLMNDALTYSLSADTYIVKFDENTESKIADEISKFNYRQFNILKNGKKMDFEALNGKRFYIGSFNQTLGEEPENITGKNVFGSYTSALTDVGFENGLNDIYKALTDNISFGDYSMREIYLNNPDSVKVNYTDLEDGKTQYDLSFINMKNVEKVGSYIERSPRNYINGMDTSISFIVNNNGLIDEIVFEDKMDFGKYGAYCVNRKALFNYAPEEAFSNDIQYGEDKLPITAEVMNKDISLNKVITHRNPNSAEVSGGVDATSWTSVYKRMADGSQRAIQVNVSSNSNYNVNGITKGMTYSEAMKHFDHTITLNDSLLIGTVDKETSSFTILCYLTGGKVGDIETKVNPKKIDYTDIKVPGSLTSSIEPTEYISAFQSINETIPNMLYKTLLRNFEIEQTVKMSGQNLSKYNDNIYGTLIYIDNGYKQSLLNRENAKALTPSRVFDEFIKNSPISSLKNLEKENSEDGHIVYTGNIKVTKENYAQLLKMSGDYTEEMLNDVSNALIPTDMEVSISVNNSYIESIMIKLSSKRDSVEYNMNVLYL